MKESRQQAILDIITQQDVETQEQLLFYHQRLSVYAGYHLP